MDFSQYSGFLLFMFIFTAGFWLLIFGLTFIVPYWLVGAWIEMYKERKNKNKDDSEAIELEEEGVL